MELKFDRVRLKYISGTLVSWGIDEDIAIKILELYNMADIQVNPWLMMYSKYIDFTECDNIFLNILNGNPLDISRKEAFIYWYFENYIKKTKEIYISTTIFKKDVKQTAKIKIIIFQSLI